MLTNNRKKFAVMFVGLSALALGACASNADVEKAQRTADQALQQAQAASQQAQAASQQAQAASQQAQQAQAATNRGFQESLRK
jgi:uncharacterized protein DUF3359